MKSRLNAKALKMLHMKNAEALQSLGRLHLNLEVKIQWLDGVTQPLGMIS